MADHDREFRAARLAAETGLDLAPLPRRARIVESIRRFAEQYERRGK